MMNQLKAIIGFQEEEVEVKESNKEAKKESEEKSVDNEFLKTRIESLDLGGRLFNALSTANIRTIGGLIRKKESDLLEIDGIGAKGIDEIRKALSKHGVDLKKEE